MVNNVKIIVLCVLSVDRNTKKMNKVTLLARCLEIKRLAFTLNPKIPIRQCCWTCLYSNLFILSTDVFLK